MKKVLSVIAGLFLVVSVAGIAAAAPFSLVDDTNYYFDSSPGISSKIWTLDLAGAGIKPGDIINSASLYIDIDDWDFSYEYADLWIDGTKKWDSKEVDNDIYSFNVLTEVSSDHKLIVKIERERGDFVVDYVKVAGTYTAVPEPSTMLLLGAGLLGLAGYGRRKFAK